LAQAVRVWRVSICGVSEEGEGEGDLDYGGGRVRFIEELGN